MIILQVKVVNGSGGGGGDADNEESELKFIKNEGVYKRPGPKISP